MPRFLCISAVAAIAFVLPARGDRKLLDHAPTPEEVWGSRERAQYDDGGAFSSKMSDHGVIPDGANLRNFVWTHWRERRRGYACYTSSYIDTAQIWHLFIEPADGDNWHITLLAFSVWAGDPRAARWEIFDQPDVVAVERAKPTEEDVHGGNDVLVLKGRDGKEVLRL